NEESRECLLFIDNEKGHNPLYVASGRVWVHSQPTDTIHGTLIGDGNVRVSIEIAKVKKAPLPIPTFEATTVENTINSFVAWPKRLVELNMSIESHGPTRVPNNAPKKCTARHAGKDPMVDQTEVQQRTLIGV
uniref:hypothetical protein n=1 Tax=Proteus mirabilis TaxID=584 RepID=UPI0015C52783